MLGGHGDPGSSAASAAAMSATLQLRETNLTGHKINYLDSGYSEEGADHAALSLAGTAAGGNAVNDQQIGTCLMKTGEGSIYIPGSE